MEGGGLRPDPLRTFGCMPPCIPSLADLRPSPLPHGGTGTCVHVHVYMLENQAASAQHINDQTTSTTAAARRASTLARERRGRRERGGWVGAKVRYERRCACGASVATTHRAAPRPRNSETHGETALGRFRAVSPFPHRGLRIPPFWPNPPHARSGRNARGPGWDNVSSLFLYDNNRWGPTAVRCR